MSEKFDNERRVRQRLATQRYRARLRGEDAPLLIVTPHRKYPEGQRSHELVDYKCIGCGINVRTRRHRIKDGGNMCRLCAVKKSQNERIAIFGSIHSPETRAKMSAAKVGRPSASKGCKRTPESMANAWAAAKLVPPEKRYRPKPRLDPAIRILRQRVRNCCGNMVKRVIKLQKICKKTMKTFEYLGYTKADFISHIEKQFKPGMSWDNWGNYDGKWNVDHIKPIAAFLDEGITDIREINALSNLQPMWAHENYRKWRTYSEPQLNLLNKVS